MGDAGPFLPQLTNPPGHSWRDKWTALSGPISPRFGELGPRRLEKTDSTVALRLGTYGDPRGVGVAYERGTPLESRHWSRRVGWASYGSILDDV